MIVKRDKSRPRMRQGWFLSAMLAVILLMILPSKSFALGDLPISSFDSFASFSARTFRVSDGGFDRSGLDYYFSYTPTKKYGVVLEGTETNLKEEDRDYLMPAGPKNQLKDSYSRHALGLRTVFFNEPQSAVKVGIHADIVLNDTKDQNGESASVTPFVYIGNRLPLSLRYAYRNEYARKTIRDSEADFSSIDKFYASQIHVRFDPYNSVARVPFGYEFYRRKGNAPDQKEFDTEIDAEREHRFFYYLPNEAQLTFRIHNGNDKDTRLSIGFEVPFY